MKKTLALSLTLILIVGLLGSLSFAEPCKYDNWKAVFGNNPELENYENAEGTVVANYVKGKKSFVISTDLWDLEPNYRYMLIYTKKIDGTFDPITLKSFSTDDYGNAEFSIQTWKIEGSEFDNYFEPTDGTSHFNVFRAPDNQRKNPWVLSTYSVPSDYRTYYPLEDAGSNRGE